MGLEILLEANQLIISSHLKDADTLLSELETMRLAGKTQPSEPEHDDLRRALALACWRAKRPVIGFGTSRLPGI